MTGECHAGFAGARSWPGVERWQTAQEGLDASGTWQPVQWRSRGPFQPAVCERGAVAWWQRLQESLAWQVWQRERSIPAAIPWASFLQKEVWSAGARVWWHVTQLSFVWHIAQSFAVAASRPSREQVPWVRVHSWRWLGGGVVRSVDAWQDAQSFFAGARVAWQAVQEAIRWSIPGRSPVSLSIPE